MSLNPGVRLGPYEVTALIGEGGMGKVWRARHTALKRDDALKVLPDAFASDPDRLARFQREAQVLASLNHPNIAHVYGLEQSAGVQAIVMELVEGPTLADRLAQGPIPVDEALPIAKQIAEALEAAHEQGIIHRDLKPANVKLRPDGVVKVLDFGLAKALEPMSAGGMDVTAAPTITSPAIMTGVGVLLGTAAYMSPEQARGKAVDKRSDIWAFGCVLYEALTGRRAFPGDNMSDVLAAVIKSDIDWKALPGETPPRLRALLQRCLEKDPRERLRDIGDARIDINQIRGLGHRDALDSAVARGSRERLAWAVAAVALVAALVVSAIVFLRPEPAQTTAFYSSIALPAGVDFAPIVAPANRYALSPDGRRLAFVGAENSEATPTSNTATRLRLWVQSFDGRPAQPLPGTDGAVAPFWSPDSRLIGFRAGNKVKVIDPTGGPLLTLADTLGTTGGTWNRDGVILFASSQAGGVPLPGNPISRVPASGGPVSPVTTIDTDNGETQHWYPFFLPNGRHFLYLALGSKAGGPASANGIYVAALDSSERKLLVPGGSNPMYAQGHLLFLRGQTLMAQPFDVERLELTGDAVPIADGVAVGGSSAIAGGFTVAETGLLAYQTGPADAGGGGGPPLSQLGWFDRSGKQLGLLGEKARVWNVELAPDGGRVAVSLFDPIRRTADVWTVDIARNLRTRSTFNPDNEISVVWSPDGNRIVFTASPRGGAFDLFQKLSSGVGPEEALLADDRLKRPLDWSLDGRFILFSAVARGSAQSDLWILPVSGDRKPVPFLQTSFTESVGRFSPDGRWIAYVSNESGRNEVYVVPFPGPGGKWQLSTAGGAWPRWRRDGREIFYLAPDRALIAAPVGEQRSAFEVGVVQRLFLTRSISGQEGYPYDVSADGQRFLVNTLAETVAPASITLVVNWPAALKK